MHVKNARGLYDSRDALQLHNSKARGEYKLARHSGRPNTPCADIRSNDDANNDDANSDDANSILGVLLPRLATWLTPSRTMRGSILVFSYLLPHCSQKAYQTDVRSLVPRGFWGHLNGRFRDGLRAIVPGARTHVAKCRFSGTGHIWHPVFRPAPGNQCATQSCLSTAG